MLEITKYHAESDKVTVEISYLDELGYTKMFVYQTESKMKAMEVFISNLHSYIVLSIENMNKLCDEVREKNKIVIPKMASLDPGTLLIKLVSAKIPLYQIKRYTDKHNRQFRLFKTAILDGMKSMREALMKLELEREKELKNVAA
jgi:hypothetical protein